ncbi:MAG TPA: hypothetical protein VNM43_06175 [Dehalococcoidia bacterium]|nr:hypothetical protein [Dehalococcoidia bacterium]
MALLVSGGAKGTEAAGNAEIKVVAPTTAQPLNTPFEVTTNLTKFVPTTLQPTWAGWSMQLAYDADVLSISSTDDVTNGGLCGGSWGAAQISPTIIAGCAFSSKTTTGTMERIKFSCKADGRATLHLVTLEEDPIQGTTMFDESAVNIPTDLVDAEVVCGTGVPQPTPTPTSVPPTPSPSPSPQASPSPSPQASPSPSPSPTKTHTATATPTVRTATPTKTATPRATATPTRTPVSQVSPVVGTPVTPRTPVGGVGPGALGPLPRSGDGSFRSERPAYTWLLPGLLAVASLVSAAWAVRERKSS